MKHCTRILALLLAILLMVTCTGCGQKSKGTKTSGSGTADYSNVTIRLSLQYGMQYAAVYVMQEKGLLEKLLPGVKLEWNNLGGGSAMNEALISGSLDVAFMGIPPALIAIDAGATYKIACGICVPPAELMVHSDSGIKSIADLDAKDKIAVPSIGSIQHIMLAMAAEKALGDANALDKNLVVMSNPDAYSALISGTDVTAHFASMPFIDLESQKGMKSILNAKDSLGGGASIVCVTTKEFAQKTAVYNALMTALGQAIVLINKHGEDVLNIIAEKESITAKQALTYLKWEGTSYTTDIYNLTTLGEFMYKAGFIKNKFPGFKNVTWGNAVEAAAK